MKQVPSFNQGGFDGASSGRVTPPQPLEEEQPQQQNSSSRTTEQQQQQQRAQNHAQQQQHRVQGQLTKLMLDVPRVTTSFMPSPSEMFKRRMSLSSPTEFPGLFDLNTASPSMLFSTNALRRWSGEDGRRRSDDNHRSKGSIDSSMKKSSERDTEEEEEEEEDLMCQEGREYLRICDYNLHSVLTNPRSTWSEALYDTLHEAEHFAMNHSIPPSPILDVIPVGALDKFVRKYGKVINKFKNDNYHRKLEGASTNKKPSNFQADEDFVSCFQAVPSQYFREDYDLTTVEVFDRELLLADQSTQERLSGYLDRVEQSLIKQISSKSDQFFEASAHQEELEQDVIDACKSVQLSRKKLENLKTLTTKHTFQILIKYRRQKRYQQIMDTLIAIKDVQQLAASIQALIHTHDFMHAYQLIEMAKEKHGNVLANVASIRIYADKFSSFSQLISTQITDRFIDTAISSEWEFSSLVSISRHKKDEGDDQDVTTSSSTVDIFEVSLNEEESERKELLRKAIETLLAALNRMNMMESVFKRYEKRLTDEVKAIVKTVVQETINSSKASFDSPENEEESKIALQLKGLSSDEFLCCLEMMFEQLLMFIKRCVVVQSIILETIGKSQEHSPKDGIGEHTISNTSTSEDEANIQKLGHSVIKKTCDLAQRSVTNLFTVRKEVQANYTMNQLRTLYHESMDFARNVEKATQQKDYTLRGVLLTQLKLFLEKHHDVQMSKLVSTLNHELWKTSEASDQRCAVLLSLHEGLLPSEFSAEATVSSSPSSLVGPTSSSTSSSSTSSASSTSASTSFHNSSSWSSSSKFIEFGPTGEKFCVVWSVLLTLEICVDYLVCIQTFPTLASDGLNKVVEILRLFNSRAMQLVLGAGAMQMARLKSISARHLGLASQSLQLVLYLLPSMKKIIQQYLPTRQQLLLVELDRVGNDYMEHNEKIFVKFTLIVEEQILKRCMDCESFKSISFDDPKCSIPTEAMKSVVENILKLYSVLVPVVPAKTIQNVFHRLINMFIKLLPKYYLHSVVETSEGKQRILQDIKHLLDGLKKIKELDIKQDGIMKQFNDAIK